MPIKNVTPARGSKVAADRPKEYQPRFKGDGAQRRSAGGRGNEQVASDDVSRVAQQETTTKWDRIPVALAYLQSYINSPGFSASTELGGRTVAGLMECLRTYVEVLEKRARNEKKDLTPTTAVQLQNEIFLLKERAQAFIKTPTEKVFDIMRFTVIPEIFNDHDITSLTLDGIGRVNIMDDISVTVEKGMKEKFMEWLVENEAEDLISETVNAQTLAAWVRQQMKVKDGKIPPADFVTIKPISRAQITRS